MGNHNIGHDALKILLDQQVEVLAVFAHPDTDDYKENWYRSVKGLALARGLPVYQPKTLKEEGIISLVKDLQPDLLLSVSFRRIIPPEILSLPSVGAINLHGSLLPAYRGRFCAVWAIVNDERISGMTLHWMDEGIDTGDIIAQVPVEIRDDDTGYSLYMRSCAAGLKLLRDTLPILTNGAIPRKPQPYFGKYYSAMSDSDRLIDWNKSTRSIYNLIRACHFPPYPSAYTLRQGSRVNVHRASIVDMKPQAPPGTVQAFERDCPIVATRDGALLLNESELHAPDVVIGELLG